MLAFNPERPMTFSFAEVRRYLAAMEDEQSRRVASIVQSALHNLALVWRGDPCSFDVTLKKQLDQRLGKSTQVQVYPIAGQFLLKRTIASLYSFRDSGGAKSYAPHRYNNVFRVVMDAWLEEVNRTKGFQFVIPKQYLVKIPMSPARLRDPLEYLNLKICDPPEYFDLEQRRIHRLKLCDVLDLAPPSIPNYIAYVVIAKRAACLTRDATIGYLKTIPPATQHLLIDHLCAWIAASGYIDARFDNLCLSNKEVMSLYGIQVPKFVVVDTKPCGLITESSDTPFPSLLASGVEKERLTRDEAAYIGLQVLHNELQSTRFSPEVLQLTQHWIEDAKLKISLDPPQEPSALLSKRRWPFSRKKSA